jgi:hypothetical protein
MTGLFRCGILKALIIAEVAVMLASNAVLAGSPQVKLLRTPNGGIQPQAIVDAKGTLHMVYFKGEPKGGDLFYVRQEAGQENFSKPIQVNSQPGSATAMGTIRGGQLAIGRNGRAHVAWNGTGKASTHPGAPMLYARLNDSGTAFEPERDLIHFTGALDGGGSVAADSKGNVYVMWHGSPPNNTEHEAGRALFVTRSSDDGKTFADEKPANPKPTGACACCGVRAFADSEGNVYALYRAASDKTDRDEVLLISRDQGKSFEIANSHPWKIASCPMSSASLSERNGRAFAAWETAAQVYFSSVDPKTLAVSTPVAPPGAAKRKHPSVTANKSGDVLFAWTEGTGWQKGGAVAWQVFDSTGKPTDVKGRLDGVPVWGLVAAVPGADGSFVLFY